MPEWREKLFKYWLFALLVWQQGCAQPDPEVIKFGLSSAPVMLDPRYATDAVSSRINRLLYERLVDFDQHFNFMPSLATWEKLSSTRYRFRLENNGRTFHNGVRLTTADVKATYESVLNPESISPHRTTIKNIIGIEVMDQDTIDFILDQPDPLFPGKLVIGILPVSLLAADHDFHVRPVGSGDLEYMDRQGEDILKLVRRSDQQRFEFITVKDPTVRILKLIRGELDLIQGDLSPELVQWLSSRKAIKITRQKGNTFSYLGFNLEDEITGQLKVRHAIAHAINRESIIRHVLDNSARLAGALLPPGHWAGHKTIAGYTYDPERARALLKEAGFNRDIPLQISYKTSSNPLRVRLATVLQDQLRAIGIKAEIESYDWGTFYGDIKSGRFQMYSLSWVGLNTPDIFRYIFHSQSIPPEGANRGRYRDMTADRFIEAAEISEDLAEQARLYMALQAHLHRQLPYIPLWFEDNILASRSDLTDYFVPINGNYDGLKTIRRQH